MPGPIIPSRINFVALRKVTAILTFLAFLASAGAAATSPCTVNCALARLGGDQHQRAHRPQAAAETHHHHHMMDMSTSATPSSQGPALRSLGCTAFQEFVALVGASRFIMTRTVEPGSRFAVTTSVSVIPMSASDFSTPAPSVSPPSHPPSPVTPIRI